MREQFTGLERVAVVVTDHLGTFGTFLLIAAWSLGWLGWNLLAPAHLRFDPLPACVLWLLISNMIQISLMPLLLVGQNLQGRHSEFRAESNYHVNVKAEREVAAMRQRLEQQGHNWSDKARPRRRFGVCSLICAGCRLVRRTHSRARLAVHANR